MCSSLQEEEEEDGERGGGDSGEGGGDPDKERHPDSSPEGIWESAWTESKPSLTSYSVEHNTLEYVYVYNC